LSRVRTLRPGLDKNIGVTISIFCAGTPSLRGTLEMFKKMGASISALRDGFS